MIPRFGRSRLAPGSLALVVALPGCAAAHTAPAPRPVTVPRPDLCTVLNRKTVGAALLGGVGGCGSTGGADYYTVRFTGDAVVRRQRTTASLTVTYTARYDPGNGLDRWSSFERPKKGRVAMIGVGDKAVFEAGAAPAPQLTVLSGDLILTVALETGKAAVPQDMLPDHLMDVAGAALDALPH
jgi:hypothetical protein